MLISTNIRTAGPNSLQSPVEMKIKKSAIQLFISKPAAS